MNKKEIRISIPTYTNSFHFNWKEKYSIKVEINEGVVTLSANSAGLESLANHFLNLAQLEVPIGTHFHLDEFNSLETESCELVVGKIAYSNDSTDTASQKA